MEEKKASFEAQDPLSEVNLGAEKELRMTKISGLLLEEDQDWLVQLIKKLRLLCLGLSRNAKVILHAS